MAQKPKKFCKATIYGDRCQSWQCSREAGSDGEFCWQHTTQDPGKEKEVWWYISRYNEPEKQEVDRSTEHRIWINGHAQDKRTRWGVYYATEKEAVNAYLLKLSRNVVVAEQGLKRAQEEYATAREKYE